VRRRERLVQHERQRLDRLAVGGVLERQGEREAGRDEQLRLGAGRQLLEAEAAAARAVAAVDGPEAPAAALRRLERQLEVAVRHAREPLPGALQRGRFGDGLVLVLHVAEEERGRGLLHARLAVRLQGVAGAPRVRRRSLQRPLLARLPDLLLEGADAFAQLLRLDVRRLSLLGDVRVRGAVAGLGRGQQLGVVLQAAAAVVRGRGRLGPLPLCLLVPRQQPGEARDVPPQALHLLRRPGRRGVIRRR